MLRKMNSSILRVAAGAFLVAGLSVASAAAQTSDVGEARLAWAERHVELVCRPLEARGQLGRAERCRDEASRVAREARAGQDATGSIRPVPDAAEMPDRPRCQGAACIRLFSSLGVGF